MKPAGEPNARHRSFTSRTDDKMLVHFVGFGKDSAPVERGRASPTLDIPRLFLRSKKEGVARNHDSG